jgi:hypothetical protein
MTGTGYEYLATKITEEIGSVTFKRDYVTQGQAQATVPTLPVGRERGQFRGRGKIDQSSRRQKWISGNDVVAHRSYKDDEMPGRGRAEQHSEAVEDMEAGATIPSTSLTEAAGTSPIKHIMSTRVTVLKLSF